GPVPRHRPKRPPKFPNADRRRFPASDPPSVAAPATRGRMSSPPSQPPVSASPQTDAAVPVPVPVDANLPHARPRASSSILLLATLAVGFTLWAAQEVILPVLLAMFFALVGNPLIRLLRRLWIPRFLGALLVLLTGLFGTTMLAVQLVGPATAWA